SPWDKPPPFAKRVLRSSVISVQAGRGHREFTEIRFPYDLHVSLPCDLQALRVAGSWLTGFSDVFGASRGNHTFHIDVIFDRQTQLLLLFRWPVINERAIVFRISPGKRAVAETSYQQKSSQNRSGGDATTLFHLFDGYGTFRLGVHLVSARGFRKQGSVDEALNTGLNQAARIKKSRFARPRRNQLQAGGWNDLIIQWNRYRQRGISSKVHRNGVLQAQHFRFKEGYFRFQKSCFADERNPWRQFLQSR